MHSSIPSKYRKTAFDRFAAVIGRVVEQFPRALVVDPRILGLTPDSYASALRSALKAKRVHHHPSSLIDEMLWAKHEKSIVVSMRADGKIIIGDSVTVKEPAGAKFGADASTVVELRDNSFLENLCGILSSRALFPALSVRVKSVDEDTRTHLEESYDIAFIEDTEPHTFIIL
jgi:hypothetical protein